LQTSDQLRAARALIRWDQKDLAEKSGVSVPTIKRLESQAGALTANVPTLAAIRTALEAAGVIFIDSNGNGPGVRLVDPLDLGGK
jgi:transcriptional regulator with XRE-family HTH domain